MPVLVLCLLCALAMAAQSALVGSMSGSEPAQQEELTVLVHGALQLSQALNGMYKAMEAQLTKAGNSLSLYGQVLGLLGKEVSQGQDAAQELRASLLEMQTEEDGLKLQAEATAQVLGEVARGQQVLRERTKQLEAQLKGVWLGHAHQEFEALKAHADEQSHIVWVLTGHVQRQKQEMMAQQQQLRQIQERLHMAALPA